MSQADSGKSAFNRVSGSQVKPVLGREIAKREQDGTILGQALGGFGILRLMGLEEPFKGLVGLARVSAIQIWCSLFLASGRNRLGSLSSTLSTSLGHVVGRPGPATGESRRPNGGRLLHHSDRRCQYASDAYQQMLRTLGIDCFMSRTGCCFDNDVAERFFWSLQHEWTEPLQSSTSNTPAPV